MELKEAIEKLNELLSWRNNGLVEIRDYEFEAIDTVLKELDKKDKVINLMAEELKEITGSCPLDSYDWENEKCDNCNNTFKDCFIEYFYKKVEEENES